MRFKNIIGHEAVKKRLIDSVKEGRISHTQLFLGAEGSGNLPMAIAFAQYVNCLNPNQDDSCGECSACVKYDKLQHPDLHFSFPVSTNADVKKNPVSKLFLPIWREIILESPYFSLSDWQEKIQTENKQLNISKEESTEIIKALQYKAYEAKYKVMIIWYPEKLHTSAANALLKILEEPPQKTLFILVAHDTEQLLPTVLSRTQMVKFPPLPIQELQTELEQKYNVSEEQALKIAKMSDGNFLQAVRLIQFSEKQQQFFNLFTSWMRMAFKADVPGLIQWTEELAALKRENIKAFLDYALHIGRESLAVNYAGNEAVKLTEQEEQFVQKFAPFLLSNNLPDFLNLLSEAHYHIERNVNPKPVMLDTSLKVAKLLRVNKNISA
jgi:DNA polymerase-3 subunit delta'